MSQISSTSRGIEQIEKKGLPQLTPDTRDIDVGIIRESARTNIYLMPANHAKLYTNVAKTENKKPKIMTHIIIPSSKHTSRKCYKENLTANNLKGKQTRNRNKQTTKQKGKQQTRKRNETESY